MTDLPNGPGRRRVLSAMAGGIALAALSDLSPARSSAAGPVPVLQTELAGQVLWYKLYSRALTGADVGTQIRLSIVSDGGCRLDGRTAQVSYTTLDGTAHPVAATPAAQGSGGAQLRFVATVTPAMVGYSLDLAGTAHPVPGRASVELRGTTLAGAQTQRTRRVVQLIRPPEAAPAAAAAAGFGRLVFTSELPDLGELDLTGGIDAAKVWYTKHPFDSTHPVQPASDFSVVDGAMRISPSFDTGPNLNLATVAPDGPVGRGLRYGYFEARLRFGAYRFLTSGTAWPSFWLYSAKKIRLAHQIAAGLRPRIPAGEIDILEYANTPDDGQWGYYRGGPATHSADTHTNVFLAGSVLHRGVLDDGLNGEGWHTYGLLWQPGRMQWFIDRVPLRTVEYGPSARPVEGGTEATCWVDGQATTCAVGELSLIDQDPEGMAIVLGSGLSPNGSSQWLDVDYVRVWQA